MIVGVPKETFPGERRVAIVPSVVSMLTKLGLEVHVEAGAGREACALDSAYTAAGAKIEASRDQLFQSADIIAMVRAYGANPEVGGDDLPRLRKGQVIVGTFEPLTAQREAIAVAASGATLFAMELVPRITRAQSMDVLSSMATVAGYKAVLLAADRLAKMFPMMMTAAGTITPARVFIIGAGVAGLQAIASARRLGAVVEAYDVRPAVKEQVESLGGKFVEMELDADAEDKGGYAKELDEEFYRKQRELMTKVVAQCDVVITTAAIPGKKAPILITADMVKGMRPGSLIVDLAAERGGNCELTKAGEDVVTAGGVIILGPENLAAALPVDASQMYSRNLTSFLKLIVKDGELNLDLEDEVIREMLVCRDGSVVHPRLKAAAEGEA